MDPLVGGGLVVVGGALVLGSAYAGWRARARAADAEARAAAAELREERGARGRAEALAVERGELLDEARNLLADAARGDQELAALAGELARVPDAGDPRERAERLLLERIRARQRRAGSTGAPGPAAPTSDGGGTAPLGA